PARWDLSAERVNTLEATTRRALAQVETPVRLLVIRPGEAEFAPVWAEVDTVLDRMIDAQPRLSRQDVDPTLQADRMRALAVELGIAPKDLKDYGAVVVQAGTRTRIVDLIEVAELDHDALGHGRMRAFRGEQAIASAIADATRRDRPILCATSGHGELPVRAGDGASDWSGLATHLDREGVEVEDVGVVSAGVPAYCRVLAVVGPTFPLSPDEALAVDRYLRDGGRLLLALGTGGDGPEPLPPSGLELVVDGFGVTFPRAIAVDRGPEVALGDLIDSFRVVETYGAHPITSAFAGRRVTVWQRPRALLVGTGEGGAQALALVSTSPAGWGETELPVPMTTRADESDLPGPVAIAAAAWRGDARLVVLGSEQALYSELAARGIGGNQTLASSAVLWLAGADARIDVGDKTPEQLRLVMTSGQRSMTFVACVLVIPLAFALVGGLVWRRRRRE
ncbi:MAG TPA: Gldg family protein, partial [Kofleriaceae bacterium]|nr:Gldg family protein [Kofleriaceae bacterium]